MKEYRTVLIIWILVLLSVVCGLWYVDRELDERVQEYNQRLQLEGNK